MPALTKTSSSRPTPPWRPHNRNSPPQQGKGSSVAAADDSRMPETHQNPIIRGACPTIPARISISKPDPPRRHSNQHDHSQMQRLKTPREKSGIERPDTRQHLTACTRTDQKLLASTGASTHVRSGRGHQRGRFYSPRLRIPTKAAAWRSHFHGFGTYLGKVGTSTPECRTAGFLSGEPDLRCAGTGRSLLLSIDSFGAQGTRGDRGNDVRTGVADRR